MQDAADLLRGWFEDPEKKTRKWFLGELSSKQRGLHLSADDVEHLFSRVEVVKGAKGEPRIVLTLRPEYSLDSAQEKPLAILLMELLGRLRDKNIEKLGLTTGNFELRAAPGRSGEVLGKATRHLEEWLEDPGKKTSRWLVEQLRSERRGLDLEVDDVGALFQHLRVGLDAGGERRIIVSLGPGYEVAPEQEKPLAILLMELLARVRDKNIEKLGLYPTDFSFQRAPAPLFERSTFE